MSSSGLGRKIQTFWFEDMGKKFSEVKHEFERLLHLPDEQISIKDVHVWKEEKGPNAWLNIKVTRFPTKTEKEIDYCISGRTFSYDYNETKPEDVGGIIDEIIDKTKEDVKTADRIAAKRKSQSVNQTAVIAERMGSLEDYLQNGDHWRGKWDIRDEK